MTFHGGVSAETSTAPATSLALSACGSDDDAASPSGSSTATAPDTSDDASSSPSTSAESSAWRMPDEGTPHERARMAFGISEDIWGDKLFEPTKAALVRIADAIARFEPVSALVEPGGDRPKVAKGVTLVEAATDDLWIRDTGPTFVAKTDKEGDVAGVEEFLNDQFAAGYINFYVCNGGVIHCATQQQPKAEK